MTRLGYPKSFPTASEAQFLDILLAPLPEVAERWETWKRTHHFHQLPEAELRLAPYLYLRLKAANIHDEYTERIRGIYKLAWVKNHRLLAATTQAVRTLEAASIAPILLKGIPLLLSVYGDMGARMLSDADLLIAPRDARRAIRLMREHGYTRHTGPFPNLDAFTDESLPRVVKEITFTNAEHIELDLHWRTFDDLHTAGHPEAFSYADIAPRAASIEHHEEQYRIPSTLDLLLHVIVHGAEGSPVKTLRWVLDSALIIRTGTIDWGALIERAVAYDVVLELRLALSYLDVHNYASIPAAVQAKLAACAVTPARMRAYYARSNQTYKRFGGLPRLWRTYWHHEADTHSLRALYGFVGYLTAAWGFAHTRDLLPFALHKYALRAAFYGRRLKNRLSLG